MGQINPAWRAPGIHGELLGSDISERFFSWYIRFSRPEADIAIGIGFGIEVGSRYRPKLPMPDSDCDTDSGFCSRYERLMV